MFLKSYIYVSGNREYQLPVRTGDMIMNPVKMISVFVLFALLLSFSTAAVDDASTPQIAGKASDAKYPFVAEVIGNNVYIRSGKGTAYYQCGKVQKGDKVTVFEEVFGWAKVVPPEGCYSWINKEFVDVESDQPTIGVLNGNNVRVWAGSDDIQPMRSSSMQTKLNSGEIVELLPDQPANDGDYYKIKPPAGAYLWINSEYLKYVEPVQPVRPPTILPQPSDSEKTEVPEATKPAAEIRQSPDQNEIASEGSDKPSPQDAVTEPESKEPPTGENQMLDICQALSDKIDQQRQKPLSEQDYDDIREKLKIIKADANAGKATIHAQILLERIERYELAIRVGESLKEQDEALARTKKQIKQAHQDKLKKMPADAEFIYTGVLQKSHVYTEKTGRQRYLLMDSSGKILCYVVPASRETAGQLKALIGERVGVEGKVSGDKNALKTLISATTVKPVE